MISSSHTIAEPTSIRTKTEQDTSCTDGSKVDPGRIRQEMQSPKVRTWQSLKHQTNDLLAIPRDIRSFVEPAYPGAGRVIIIISIFSLSEELIGAACIALEGWAAHTRHQSDVGSPPYFLS
ncbi:hypothetical protein LZL87_013793 [Fusarium oxysporum]|nr:hypothetical protein LZL87_013793 [Fusarium oxysporum]